MKIALVGNPNSGKTTLFNELTGSNQYVGNWPGVTVEKKEGRLKDKQDISIVDLPGIYSLSPYTMEEVVSRDYLLHDSPQGIINIVDGTNLQRNLFLTSQLVDLDIPMVLAVNMADAMEKEGYVLDTEALSQKLNIPVVKISASKGQGFDELIAKIKEAVNTDQRPNKFKFSDQVGSYIGKIANYIGDYDHKDWYAIKAFERDKKALDKVDIRNKEKEIDEIISQAEKIAGQDSESIVTEERYTAIGDLTKGLYYKKDSKRQSFTERLDKFVLNKFLALPIFVLVIFLVYYISISTVGTAATDFVNDGVFGDGFFLFGRGAENYEQVASEYETSQAIKEAYDPDLGGIQAVDLYDEEGNVSESLEVGPDLYREASTAKEPDPSAYGSWIPGLPVLVEGALESLGVGDFLTSLILEGIVAGVGAVLGFLPQMFVLFLCLAFLEGSGYMARIAFILDRIFRQFGLSGKSFIPMLIGTGCSVPGIMATRTIESESDRRLSIITTSFIPCSAKLPVIALIAGAIFGGSWWVAPSCYFLGILAVIISGIILKKTSIFEGDTLPFVMELPAYRLPGPKYLLNSAFDRSGAFVKKAATIVLLSTIVIWLTSNYGFGPAGFGKVEMDDSILAGLGRSIAWIFTPLGWGRWENAVASISGLVAKENVVSSFAILYGAGEVAENGWEIWSRVAGNFTQLSAYSFLVFNLLAAPCFAAIGAIKSEMGSGKWTLFAVGYLTIFAYLVAFLIYQFGLFFTGNGFNFGTIMALLVLLLGLYLLLRPEKKARLASRKI